MDQESLERLARIIREQRIAALGTLRNGAPYVSMVLFAVAPDFSEFYIHTSTLAHHTQDLRKDARVGLMIAETDTVAAGPRKTEIPVRGGGDRDPQTLARVSISGEAFLLPAEDAGYAAARDAYVAKHPQTAFSFGFADFAVYRIRVEGARYVAGFAKAFNLKPAHFRQASEVEV